MNLDYLIIAAHPDDEVIGCSSIFLKDANIGVLHITKDYDTETKARNEIYKKMNLDYYKNLENPIFKMPKMENLAEKIVDVLNETKAKRVFTHYSNDMHQDHIFVSKATEIAVRMNRNNFVKGLYQYYVEKPFDLENCKFLKLEKSEKIKMLTLYEEYINTNHWETILAFNKFCGVYSNQYFAEPFKIIWERF